LNLVDLWSSEEVDNIGVVTTKRMPNQRNPEKTQVNVWLPDHLSDKLEQFRREKGLSKAEALALLIGQSLPGVDQAEVDRVMGWNSEKKDSLKKPKKAPKKKEQ